MRAALQWLSAAARAQDAAMAKAATTLKAAVDRAVSEVANARAVSATPTQRDGLPMVRIDLLAGGQLKSVLQQLD